MPHNAIRKRAPSSSGITAPAAPRINAAIRKIFLIRLAETSNVAASARAANVSSAAIYAERRRSPDFRDEWAAALSEGYAKLEADLLAEAMQSASAQTSDAMLKSRAQKHRLALALLAAHRMAVKGMPPAAKIIAPVSDARAIKEKLLAKLDQMRVRAEVKITNNNNESEEIG
jgi:hypothetical protein